MKPNRRIEYLYPKMVHTRRTIFNSIGQPTSYFWANAVYQLISLRFNALA